MSAAKFLRVRSVGGVNAWGDWFTQQMRACGFGTDEALAEAIGVSGPTVHRWRKGARPDVVHLRQLVDPLRTGFRELLVVSGTLTERELGGRVEPPLPLSARELIGTDRTLSAEARGILLAAYDAAASPALSDRAAARRNRSKQ